MRLAILALGAVGVLASPVHAQPVPRWLLLPVAAEGAPAHHGRFTTDLARELRGHGAYVVAFDEATALFEARESSAPASANATDLDVVAREAKQALWNVATGHNERARQAVTIVLQRAERALESLNRQTDAARHVLNACLYMVRAMLDSGNEAAASSQVLECRRLVPDIEPDPHDHPPQVLELLHKAELQMSTAGTGTLHVDSTPKGCRLYVNGRELGTTPATLGELPPGEYRVQAECNPDHPARVHRVVLAAEPTHLHIDTRFDAAVRSDDQLRLSYSSPQIAREQRLPDGTRVAHAVDAGTVLLMTPVGAHSMRFDRIDASDGHVVASVLANVDGRRASVRRQMALVADALWEGRSSDVTSGEPKPMQSWQPPPPPAPPPPAPKTVASAQAHHGAGERSATAPKAEHRARSPMTPRQVAGWSMLGAGVGALAASWGLYALTQSRGDRFGQAQPSDPDYLDRQARFDRARFGAGAGFAAGGGLATAAVTLLLPDRDKGAARVPWWGWAAGGVGVGLFAWGLVPMVAGDAPPLLDHRCIDQGCTRHEPTRMLGFALWMHAAPLLAVPLTYLMRPLFGGSARVSVGATPDEAKLEVGGTF